MNRPADVSGWTLAQLSDRLRSESEVLPVEAVLELAQAVARQLDELHEAGRVHGRLRPEGVLIDRGGGVHLMRSASSDGDAREVARKPPEELAGAEGGPATDTYGLALLVVEALAGGNPLLRSSAEETRSRVLRGLQGIQPPGLDLAASMWLETCLLADPAQRPQCRLEPIWSEIRFSLGPPRTSLAGLLQSTFRGEAPPQVQAAPEEAAGYSPMS